MENQVNEKVSRGSAKKNESAKSWGDYALDFGMTVLTGLCFGAGSAAGARFVSSTFSGPVAGNAETEGRIVPLRKVGSA
ncbi:hypothetical protein WDW86_15760 [Bdellovibrionota bacterium FG-2]